MSGTGGSHADRLSPVIAPLTFVHCCPRVGAYAVNLGYESC